MWHMHPSIPSTCKQNTSYRHRGMSYYHLWHICAYTILYIFSSRYLVTQLQNVINKLASSQHPHMPSMSVSALSEGKPEAFVVPGAPDPLDKEDYPDVQYWHDKDWIKHTK